MLWTAFILGLLGSWHCIGMCGPIALMIPGAKGKNRFVAVSLYHAGKILSYLLLGSLFGLFSIFLSSLKIQSIISILGGVFILILALAPFVLNYVERKGFKAFQRLINFKQKISSALNKNRLEFGFYIGFLNGFIPCGLVYIAAIGAMVQTSFVDSLLYMLMFGLGTLPLLASFQILASGLKNRPFFKMKQLRTAGFLFVGCFLIWKGVSAYQNSMKAPKEGETIQVCLVAHQEKP